MNKHRTKDKIDAELSKTYFGNALRTIDLDNDSLSVRKKNPSAEKTTMKRDKKSPGKRRSLLIGAVILAGRLRPFFIAISILAILSLAVILFISHNRMVFDFNINVEPTNVERLTAPLVQFKENNTQTALPGSTNISPIRPLVTEKTLYDFENGDNGWEIPFWATEKPDHVASYIESINDISSSGKSSIGIYAEFLPGRWSAALIETQHYLDLSSYNSISAKAYLPPDAIDRLSCELILTVGDDWRFVEMARKVKLIPGKWITINADISEGSIDWKRTVIDTDFKKDIRKISLRITSDGSPYSGLIYVDEIKVSP